MDYYKKYLKYKNDYFLLKNKVGGRSLIMENEDLIQNLRMNGPLIKNSEKQTQKMGNKPLFGNSEKQTQKMENKLLIENSEKQTQKMENKPLFENSEKQKRYFIKKNSYNHEHRIIGFQNESKQIKLNFNYYKIIDGINKDKIELNYEEDSYNEYDKIKLRLTEKDKNDIIYDSRCFINTHISQLKDTDSIILNFNIVNKNNMKGGRYAIDCNTIDAQDLTEWKIDYTTPEFRQFHQSIIEVIFTKICISILPSSDSPIDLLEQAFNLYLEDRPYYKSAMLAKSKEVGFDIINYLINKDDSIYEFVDERRERFYSFDLSPKGKLNCCITVLLAIIQVDDNYITTNIDKVDDEFINSVKILQRKWIPDTKVFIDMLQSVNNEVHENSRITPNNFPTYNEIMNNNQYIIKLEVDHLLKENNKFSHNGINDQKDLDNILRLFNKNILNYNMCKSEINLIHSYLHQYDKYISVPSQDETHINKYIAKIPNLYTRHCFEVLSNIHRYDFLDKDINNDFIISNGEYNTDESIHTNLELFERKYDQIDSKVIRPMIPQTHISTNSTSLYPKNDPRTIKILDMVNHNKFKIINDYFRQCEQEKKFNSTELQIITLDELKTHFDILYNKNQNIILNDILLYLEYDLHPSRYNIFLRPIQTSNPISGLT